MIHFNLYMDELGDGEGRPGQTFPDVVFRIVTSSEDEGDPENDAVLSGLDIHDLIDLRQVLQEVIDVIAASSVDPAMADRTD